MHLILVSSALIVLWTEHSLSLSPQPGAQWTRDEITATRERIWNILKNPNNFVGSKDKAPVPDKACNRECWHGRAFC